MKIVHVIEPFASGVTTAVVHIAEELPDMEHLIVHGSRMWVDTIDKTKSRFPSYVRFEPWKYAQREINPLLDGLALVWLIGILSHQRDAVVHLHSSKAGFLGRLACRVLGIRRVIYTPHCGAFLRTDIGAGKRKLYRSLEILAGKFGGLVVGCGPTEAELYRELGLEARYVSNGVEPETREASGKGNTVTFVGIANEQKNPALFNRIARSFGNEDGTRFLWVGDGALRGELEEGVVEATGWVDKEAVYGFLHSTLVYLSTSGWEGLPFGVLEAMNASCALLLHDVPGNRDLVQEGRNGYLFRDEGEAVARLRELLSDPERTAAMGRESRRIVAESFSLKAMGAGYREIYTSLMGS